MASQLLFRFLALHDKVKKDRETKGWPLTEKLLLETVKCRSDADFLFTEVLNRKERADATRNALSVLQRFKFLFFLPSNIERNVAKVSLIQQSKTEALLWFMISGYLCGDFQRLHSSEIVVHRDRSASVQGRYELILYQKPRWSLNFC